MGTQQSKDCRAKRFWNYKAENDLGDIKKQKYKGASIPICWLLDQVINCSASYTLKHEQNYVTSLLKMCVSKIINTTTRNLDIAVSAAKGIIYLAPAQQHQNTIVTTLVPESPINLDRSAKWLWLWSYKTVMHSLCNLLFQFSQNLCNSSLQLTAFHVWNSMSSVSWRDAYR